jgi:carboxyl-terminal processing protease
MLTRKKVLVPMSKTAARLVGLLLAALSTYAPDGLANPGNVERGINSGTAQVFSSSDKQQYGRVVDEAWKIIFDEYLDTNGRYSPQQWSKLRGDLQARSYSSTKESYEAIRRMLNSLDDPYTRFIEPQEVKEVEGSSQELAGVGIHLSSNMDTEELVVISPVESSPASRAGIQPRDVLVSIDGTSTKGMSTADAIKLIRGRSGTTVNITLRRRGQKLDLALTRELIKLHAVVHQVNTSPNGVKVGYIRLKQFNAMAAKDMQAAIRDLEARGVQGYVLDLRSNPGGLFNAAVEIAQLWLDHGIIMRSSSRNGIQEVKLAQGPALTKLPLVVLVNQRTAAAAEILASALRDNKRALLVGEKTYGLGRMQRFHKLSDGSGMYVTNSTYKTAKGAVIEKSGILPDVVTVFRESDGLKLTARAIGTQKDSQYRVAEETLLKVLRRARERTLFFTFRRERQALEPQDQAREFKAGQVPRLGPPANAPRRSAQRRSPGGHTSSRVPLSQA